MIRKALMAATILLLLLLVLVTPRLIGVREDISSLPRLILNYDAGEFIIFITSLSGTYVYKVIHLNVTPENANATVLLAENSHGLEGKVDPSVTPSFLVEATALDQRETPFDATAQVEATQDEGGWSFSIRLTEDTAPRILTDEELSASPLATLMQRRETP